MPALQAPKKISRRQELRQDAVVTATARTVRIVDEYRTAVIGFTMVFAIAVVSYVGYFYYQVEQGTEAAAQLGSIVVTYEQGLWGEALDGTAGNMGLIEIVARYGGTDDGNLARFYAGDALYRLDRKEEALEYFEAYDKDDNYLGAAAFGAEAAIHEDLGNSERAAERYRRAALSYENSLTSPEYLLAAARSYEATGDYAAAREMYKLIETRFPEADAVGGLGLYYARLDALQGAL
jgi:tetratricopeptide (TPR) repeat protein